MAHHTIRAITFDAAHTIFHPHPSVGAIYQEVMLRFGLNYSASELEAGFQGAFTSVAKDETILDSEARERSYWKAIVAASIRRLEPQPDDFVALFDELWEEFALGHRWKVKADTAPLLSELRSRGFIVSLLTNWDSRVHRVIADSQVKGCFDHVFVSSEIGFEKPDPRIFKSVQERLNLRAKQILHVGDSLQHDIEGALSVGWQAIRLLSEAPPVSRYPSIRSLPELLEIVK